MFVEAEKYQARYSIFKLKDALLGSSHPVENPAEAILAEIKNKIKTLEAAISSTEALIEDDETKVETLIVKMKHLREQNDAFLLKLGNSKDKYLNTLNQCNEELKEIYKQVQRRELLDEIDKAISRLEKEESLMGRLDQLTEQARGRTREMASISNEVRELCFTWELAGDFDSQDERLGSLKKKFANLEKKKNRTVQQAAEVVKAIAGVTGAVMQEYQDSVPGEIRRQLKILEALNSSLSKEMENVTASVKKKQVEIDSALKIRAQHNSMIQYEEMLTQYLSDIHSDEASFAEVAERFSDISGKLQFNGKALKLCDETFKCLAIIQKEKGGKDNNQKLLASLKVFASFLTAYIQDANPKGIHEAHVYVLSILSSLQQMKFFDLSTGLMKNMGALLDLSGSATVIEDIKLCLLFKMPVLPVIIDIANDRVLANFSAAQITELLQICEQIGLNRTGKQDDQKIASSEFSKLQGKFELYSIREHTQQLSICKDIPEVAELVNKLRNKLKTHLGHYEMLIALDLAFNKMNVFRKAGGLNNTKKKPDMSGLLDALSDFLSYYQPNPKNASTQHKFIINILRNINEMQFAIMGRDKTRIASLLCFAHIKSTVTLQALSEQLLICARAGISIRESLERVCTELFINGTDQNNLSIILYACCLHDTSYPSSKIPEKIVKACLDRAKLLQSNETSKSSKRKGAADTTVIEKMFYSNSAERFQNNNLKDVKFARFLLMAVAFYGYSMGEDNVKYLSSYVEFNDENTISEPQKNLFLYLTEQFKDQQFIKITMEQKAVAGMSADLLIFNQKTGKRVNVEYDGLDHYYKRPNFTCTFNQLREDRVRDFIMTKNGYEVLRVNVNDFCITKTGKLLTSQRLRDFISNLKGEDSSLKKTESDRRLGRSDVSRKSSFSEQHRTRESKVRAACIYKKVEKKVEKTTPQGLPLGASVLSEIHSAMPLLKETPSLTKATKTVCTSTPDLVSNEMVSNAFSEHLMASEEQTYLEYQEEKYAEEKYEEEKYQEPEYSEYSEYSETQALSTEFEQDPYQLNECQYTEFDYYNSGNFYPVQETTPATFFPYPSQDIEHQQNPYCTTQYPQQYPQMPYMPPNFAPYQQPSLSPSQRQYPQHGVFYPPSSMHQYGMPYQYGLPYTFQNFIAPPQSVPFTHSAPPYQHSGFGMNHSERTESPLPPNLEQVQAQPRFYRDSTTSLLFSRDLSRQPVNTIQQPVNTAPQPVNSIQQQTANIKQPDPRVIQKR